MVFMGYHLDLALPAALWAWGSGLGGPHDDAKRPSSSRTNLSPDWPKVLKLRRKNS